MKTFEFEVETMDDQIVGSFMLRGEQYDIRALQDTATAVLIRKMRNSKGDVALAAVLDFTEVALTPDSAKRFAALCLDNPKTALKWAQINEVFRYVLGVVAANPIGSASASLPPPVQIGTDSPASVPSQV